VENGRPWSIPWVGPSFVWGHRSSFLHVKIPGIDVKIPGNESVTEFLDLRK
jgi:hypothetical protein